MGGGCHNNGGVFVKTTYCYDKPAPWCEKTGGLFSQIPLGHTKTGGRGGGKLGWGSETFTPAAW